MRASTMLRLTFGLVVILCSLSRPAQASCDAILGSSVRDFVRVKTSSEDYARHLSDACSTYQLYENDKTNDNLGLLTQDFYLSNVYSGAQVEQIAKAACTYASDVTDATAAKDIYMDTVDANAIAAWAQCNALRATFDPSITFPDDGKRTVVVSLRYQGHETSSVTSVAVDDPVRCTGDLGLITAANAQSFRSRLLQPNATVTETCVRPLSTDPNHAYSTSGGMVYALPVNVIFSTPDGPVTASLQPLPVTPASTSANVPIGGIVDWFTKAGATTLPDGYQICDGSQIIVGPLAGIRTPNLVHRFTMGVSDDKDVDFQKSREPKDMPRDATGALLQHWTATTGENNGEQGKSKFESGDCAHGTSCSAPEGHTHTITIEYPPYVGLLKIIRIR